MKLSIIAICILITTTIAACAGKINKQKTLEQLAKIEIGHHLKEFDEFCEKGKQYGIEEYKKMYPNEDISKDSQYQWELKEASAICKKIMKKFGNTEKFLQKYVEFIQEFEGGGGKKAIKFFKFTSRAKILKNYKGSL